jgi:hypothetical protein
VPDAITANNEGNLETSPTYVGRMFCLRPWESRVSAILSVQAGGSSYAIDDTITLNGVAGNDGAPVLTVTEVSSGAVVAVSITQAQGVQHRRHNMDDAPSPAENPVGQASTSGSGTGATFNAAWEPHFELRYITADASQTLTIHEDWIIPPVSGDAWAVSYILDDYATLTGLTLRAQSGVFEATRDIKVGAEDPTTRQAWLSINDGKALELDNVGTPMIIASAGTFTVGYLERGIAVNGGYITTSDTSGSSISLGGTTPEGGMNCLYYIYDLQGRGPRAELDVSIVMTSLEEVNAIYWDWAKVIIQDSKIFFSGFHSNRAGRIRNVTLQGNDAVTAQMFVGPADDADPRRGIINGMTLTKMDEPPGILISLRSTTTSALIMDRMRNMVFISPQTMLIECEENETWRMVNPGWTPVLTDQTSDAAFNFASTTGTSIEQLMSLIVRPVTAAGVAVSGVHGYVYEGGLNNDLPTENTEQSDAAAFDPIPDSRFEDEIEVGANAYFCDVLDVVYTPNSTTDTVSASRDIQAWRGYDYGNSPVTIPLVIELDGGLDLSPTFLVDEAITETDQATALSNPTVDPVVTKHGPGESDTRPMKVLNYDAGAGTVPTLGETLTQGSATGDVVEFLGSAVSGTVLLENWNGTEFTEDSNITGATFDATTDLTGGTGFYEEYTWELDASAEDMTVVYDFIAARMAEDPITAPFDDVIVWGGDEVDATQLLGFDGADYFTPRAVRRQDGILQAGAAADFSDAFAQADSDLSADSNWEDVDNATNGIRVITNEAGGDNSAGTTNVTSVVTGTHAYVPNQYATATIDALPTAGDRIGIAARVDAVREQCYAAIVAEGTPDTYEIVHVDFSTSAGVITTLAAGASVPAATDVISLIAVENTLIMFVNDVEEVRYVDNELLRLPLTTGQMGIFAEGDATPAGRLDDFESGDFVDAVIHGEGVWIHDRGAGGLSHFTSDDGVEYVPAASVVLRVEGVTEGTPCSMIAAETAGSVTDGDVLMEVFADANGVAELAGFIYEAGFGAGLDVDVRARNAGVLVAAIRAQGAGPTFTRYEAEAASPDASAFSLLSLTIIADDSAYFGHSEQFGQMKINLSGANVGTGTINYEYWDGLAWSALSDVVDGTVGWTVTGLNNIAWTIPGDWAKTTVDGTSAYYIRGRLNPIGDAAITTAIYVTVDATRYKPYPEEGVVRRTITSSGLTVIAVWIEDTIGKYNANAGE